MWRHSRQTALMLELLPELRRAAGDRRARSPSTSRGPDDVRLDPRTSAAARCSTSAATASAPRVCSRAASPTASTASRRSAAAVSTSASRACCASERCSRPSTAASSAETAACRASATKGELRADDPWHATEARVFLNGEEHRAEDVDPYRLELENFAAAVRGEATAAPRPRRRARPGAHARRAAPVGGARSAGRAVPVQSRASAARASRFASTSGAGNLGGRDGQREPSCQTRGTAAARASTRARRRPERSPPPASAAAAARIRPA